METIHMDIEDYFFIYFPHLLPALYLQGDKGN